MQERIKACIFFLLAGSLPCLPWQRQPQALVFLFILLHVSLSIGERSEGDECSKMS